MCTDCGIEIPESEVLASDNGLPDLDGNGRLIDIISDDVKKSSSGADISQSYGAQGAASSSSTSINGPKNSSGTPRSMDGIIKNNTVTQSSQNSYQNSSDFEGNINKNSTPLSNKGTQKVLSTQKDNSVTHLEEMTPPMDPFSSAEGTKKTDSDIFRNPIFDEKIPIQEDRKKNIDTEVKTTNKYLVIVIFGIILVGGLIFGGVYSYYTLSKKVSADKLVTTTTIPEWTEYSDPADKFVLTLPGDPVVSQNDIALSGTTISSSYVTSAVSDVQYILQYSTLPDNFVVTSLNEFYQGILIGMLGDSAGEIVSNKEAQFLENKGCEFLVKIGDNYSSGKMVLINKELYVILVISKTDAPSDYDKFINSFELKHKEV